MADQSKPLDCGMNNLLAYKLGEIAADAGNPERKGVGDYIDRGLILRRLMEEKGFGIIELSSLSRMGCKCETMRERVLGDGCEICNPTLAAHIADESASASPRVGDLITIEELELAHIKAIVAKTSSLGEATRILGIDIATPYRKRRKHGMEMRG